MVGAMPDGVRLSYLDQLGVDAWMLRTPGARPVEQQPASVESQPEPIDEAARALDARIDAIMPGSQPEVRAPRRPLKELLAESESEQVKPSQSVIGAAAPRDWQALQAQVSGCTACSLCEHRTQTVFGAGNQSADVLFVGEGPGADEDRQGEPFVGTAGKLLDKMLAAIDRSRSDDHLGDVYITNVVKCRPPGNRKPSGEEAAACADYLDAQIELVKPKLIVALGAVAAARLLGEDTPVGKLRAAQTETLPQYRGTPVFVTYHPAYYLRTPAEKRKGWEDLKRVRRVLAAPS